MRIRAMTQADLATVLGWARDEGWNPGLDDAPAFLAADPEGFLLGEIDGAPVAAIAVPRHAPDVAFLGLYLCRPEWRGKGCGLAVWRAGVARLEGARVGLDGVIAQQDNYRRSGFALAHRNLRWSGRPKPGAPRAAPNGARIVAATSDLVAPLTAYDAAITGYARPAFLAEWLTQTHTRRAMALLRDGAVCGYGAIRACVEGAKVGPLYADAPEDAPALLSALLAQAPNGPVALDAPEPNAAAAALARALGLAPAFETARMWRGPAPLEDLRRVFGVASFELG